jgi:hypothetical protein
VSPLAPRIAFWNRPKKTWDILFPEFDGAAQDGEGIKEPRIGYFIGNFS